MLLPPKPNLVNDRVGRGSKKEHSQNQRPIGAGSPDLFPHWAGIVAAANVSRVNVEVLAHRLATVALEDCFEVQKGHSLFSSQGSGLNAQRELGKRGAGSP
jgi:hypothetical protein